MNKQELIGQVADRAGLNRNDAVRAVETMLEVVTSALKRGDEVRLVGFGNFSVTRRKASPIRERDDESGHGRHAIGQAPGVVSTQTDGVAIVLGSNLLPNGTG